MNPSAAARDAVFVDQPQALAEAVAAVRAAPIVGFDTEFVGESTYEPLLCLIQVAAGERIFVIDPLARLDLREFWSALTAPDKEVVALAARQELLFCLRFAGRLPGTLFDPQIAAGLVGHGYPLSHTNLVQRVLGARVEGGEAYTDWRKRPLAARQIAYAGDDVRHLLDLRSALLAGAESLGRVDWLLGECERSKERLLESEDEERWWRVSGATGLSRRNLGVLRELWRWRDDTARAADQPPRRILTDDLMVMIARRGPRTTSDLFALRGMERPQLRKAGSDIVAAVRIGLELPDDELPLLRRRDDPPQVAVLGQLLSVLANSLAIEHQVEPSLLATTADLQHIVRWHLGLTDEESQPSLLEGWRGQILGEPLIALLDGRMVVRVADVRSPNPLRVEPA